MKLKSSKLSSNYLDFSGNQRADTDHSLYRNYMYYYEAKFTQYSYNLHSICSRFKVEVRQREFINYSWVFNFQYELLHFDTSKVK